MHRILLLKHYGYGAQPCTACEPPKSQSQSQEIAPPRVVGKEPTEKASGQRPEEDICEDMPDQSRGASFSCRSQSHPGL